MFPDYNNKLVHPLTWPFSKERRYNQSLETLLGKVGVVATAVAEVVALDTWGEEEALNSTTVAVALSRTAVAEY